ncbi:hypothetical protein OEZ86_001592 [Tetradesmus obliquus]|nr:hypothetical protein OEZ86_001592 [Tetradesmus obliquus]
MELETTAGVAGGAGVPSSRLQRQRRLPGSLADSVLTDTRGVPVASAALGDVDLTPPPANAYYGSPHGSADGSVLPGLQLQEQEQQQRQQQQQHSAESLEEENRRLHAREAILLAYCQTLSWLRQQECNEWTVLAELDNQQQQQQQQQEGLLLASDTDKFSEEELLLLQQLQVKLTDPLTGSLQQEPTVAPDGDLLYYFRRIFSLPRYPGAADMTMQDVSKAYNEENLRAAFDRLSNKYVTLAQLQRGSVMMVVALANHADMSQPLLPEANLDDHIRCVRQMGLSAAQKQQIADGYAVFSQLLQPGVLHQQEQHAAQLKQLMQKDVLVKLAFTAYTFGRCKYTQLAKLYVLMYPRHPAIGAIGRAVDAIFKEDQARQGTRPGARQ